MGNPTEDNSPNPQSSETADPAELAGPSGLASLNRVVSAPTHEVNQESTRKMQTHPPRGKVPSPVHQTAHPKERPPGGPPVTLMGSVFTVLFVAHRPVEAVPSVLKQLRNIATYSWLNVLLIFIPISWAAVSDFPLILSVACSQAASHCLSYSSELTLLCTLWY